MIKTRVTDLFHISYPVMSAPMAMHSGGRLAAAISEGGGLGLFGGINVAGADWVRDQIRYVRSYTDKPFGLGYITHLIPAFQQSFEVALEEKVPAIAFSFADPTPWLDMAKKAGAMTICQVQNMEGARQAVDAGADVLVAQGNEAGGHTGTWNLLPFLAKVVEAFPDTPVMAAGGIASGRTLVAVLAAGGEGAWLGTAFLATPEVIEIPDGFKDAIVRSDGEDTLYTNVFDIVMPRALNIPPWPKGIGSRAYNNRFAQEWHHRESELIKKLDEVAPQYAKATEERNPEVAPMYFGQSAAFVEAIRPAKEVLRTICDEAERLLRQRVRELLG